jgi:predicted dithiol-disulfide oxidoreductase (DUF899 family)
MGWSFPWASSLGSDFNFDFAVSFREEQQREGVVEYNIRSMDVTPVLEAGGEGLSPRSQPGPEPTQLHIRGRGQE